MGNFVIILTWLLKVSWSYKSLNITFVDFKILHGVCSIWLKITNCSEEHSLSYFQGISEFERKIISSKPNLTAFSMRCITV